MVVVMKAGATKEDVDRVVQKVKEAGGDSHIVVGEFKTIVGLVGDTERFMELPLTSLPGVESVVRIGKPYKLVSRSAHPALTDVKVGPATVSRRTFSLIAGPCAVESLEQSMAAAVASKAAGATILRGGAYKPRSSPYTFQGLGV
ncbi:MAG: 3-deoxy-7-phosphoheptulonate synthase, partial [Actinobacteria bacterium]|nr:3-deoxy-7-phosphoheptulonate synthase [Actinomycetota bacterium]